MTVRAEKPSVNLREKLAELDKPTGIAGEAMLRAETPQEQQALIGVGRKNLLINGDFQVNQRGTSVSGTAYFYGAADRWQGYGYSSNSATIAVVDSAEILPNGNAISRYLSATSTSNRVFVLQRVENVAQFSGQKLTLSGWVKSPSGNACIGTDFECGAGLNYGTGGSTAESVTGFTDGTKSGIVLTDAWQKFEITFTVPDKSAKTFGPNNTSYMDIYLTSDSVSGTLHFANLQLELGKVATPFEHRSYGEELALCQRYYERFNYNTETWERIVTGFIPGTTTSNVMQSVFQFSEKRATPTISMSAASTFRQNGGGTSDNQATAVSANTIGKRTFNLNVTGNSRTSGLAGWISRENNSQTYLEIDAEL